MEPVPLLRPAGWLWGAAAAARAAAYDAGVLRSVSLGCPAVSVGNLTAGGTGKTPCTMLLLGLAARRGLSVGLLTRGYGGDGATNDEVEMVRAQFPGVPVGVGGDRVAAARALRREHPELRAFLLDDAFQHRRVARDLDLVLVDATDPFGGGAFLPAGRLREPRRALRRAGVVILTRADQADANDRDATWRAIEGLGYAGPRVEAAHRPAALEPLGAGTPPPLEELRGRPVRLLSSIARPGSFARTAEALGARVIEQRAFPDHHRYLPADLPDLRPCDGAWWITTEKDAPKLRRLGVIDGLVLRVRFEVSRGEEELRRRVEGAWGLPR